MSAAADPILIACAHGTNNPAGRECIDRVREEIAALRPGLQVLEAYVDVQDPALPDVVAALPDGTPAVVVPLLLSVGYHVRVDIARAVGSRPELRAAAPLGPDPRLAALLGERLHAVPEDWAIVLAAAGSSDPTAAQSVEELAAQLRRLTPQPILAGYGASAQPSVPAAVARLKSEGAQKVAIASYLLAPGYFHDQLAKAGADLVTEPLLPAEAVAQLALDRFDQALGRHPRTPVGKESP